MGKINLKKYIDQTNTDLIELALFVNISVKELKEIYRTGLYNGDKVGVHQLILMATFFEISIHDLVPSKK